MIEVATDDAPLGLLFGLVFMISGLAFKVSAAPFHMWTPDVYEGSPTPVTTFFATAPKVAAMAMFARVVHDAFGGIVSDWQQIVALLSVLSMFVGALAAIGQMDIKRLMAYSSIAHMGYALMGLAAGTSAGVSAMLLYMAIYVVMNIGTFAFILSMQRDGRDVSNIASLKMLSKVRPRGRSGVACADVLPCRRASDARVLRQIRRRHRGNPGRSLLAGRAGHDRLGPRRRSTICASSTSCISARTRSPSPSIYRWSR